jgi:uncharacterized protein (TIGR02246 family)
VKTDQDAIRQLIAEWHRRSAKGELDALLELMTEDAVFLTCGQAPMSRAEFAAGFREWSAKASMQSSFEVKDIQVCGDLAYAWSYLRIVMTPRRGGASVSREGHTLSVFRRSAAGKWLLARDANLIGH